MRFFTYLLSLLVLMCVMSSGEQTTLFNVTLGATEFAPPAYFTAAVPGVAAVLPIIQGEGTMQGYGIITAVNNSTGGILWQRNATWFGYGDALAAVAHSGAFVFYDADGSLVIADARTGTVKWRHEDRAVTAQVFTLDAVSGLLANVDNIGRLLLVDAVNASVVWQTVLGVPKWTPGIGESTLFIALSSTYVVVADSGILFVVAVGGAGHHEPLHIINASTVFTALSGRYAIAGDTLVFCGSSNISVLSLSTGQHHTVATLNTDVLTYNEVVVSPDGSRVYIVAIDGSFRAPRYKARGGNNYPMYVLCHSLLTGGEVWSYFTDETVGNLALVNGLASQQVVTAVALMTSSGPVALNPDSGVVATFVEAGIDYMESAPPLVYGQVWYFATEYNNYPSPPTINFVSVSDTLL